MRRWGDEEMRRCHLGEDDENGDGRHESSNKRTR